MTDIEINPQFALAKDKIQNPGCPLMISGKAGTGKSTLLAHLSDILDHEPVILAPTGVAALNVGGQTIHRFFGWGIDVTPEKVAASSRIPDDPDLYKQMQIMIIDEVSMVRADLLDCVDAFLRKHGPQRGVPFGGVRVVFVGDLYQLAPIIQKNQQSTYYADYNSPYFFASKVLQETGVELLELDKVYRQKDQDFVGLLNRVRENQTTQDDLNKLNERFDSAYEPDNSSFAIYLTTTNRNAQDINTRCLSRLTTPECVSHAKMWGDVDAYPTERDLAFREGAQIMMLTNDRDNRWVNGSIGIIEEIHADGARVMVRMKDNDNLVIVTPYTWKVIKFIASACRVIATEVGQFTQLPFRLAWAITIHKSQGKTFDHVVIDLQNGAFADGQTYVALSRCTSFEGIVLHKRIERRSIRADKTITEFLDKYRNG